MTASEGSDPLMRAGMLQPVLGEIRRLDDEARDRVLAQIGEEQVARIENASRTKWLSFEAMLEVDAALHAELGEEAFVEFWRDFVGKAAQIPLLRPLAEGAARLFRDPRRIFRLLPHAYGLALKNLGDPSFEAEADEDRLEIQLSNVPPLSSPGLFASACRGSFMGMLKLLDIDGEVEVNAWGADAGLYRFLVRWG